ncbi:MAG: hypothetical protein A3G26_09330 [Betaproteobacteria bacterium RIFCSPLOWO2_12_FULL_65_110]|nr:MAG: hypothetical protein A3G26_09330 [Betaproteobacteria bacterium RIFCSPLOWO2_12_FULL_65_110]
MKLPAFLAARAAATPDREALVCGDLRLSFAELDRHSSCLAAALAQHGVGAGDRVAIYLPNCAEFVLAFVAIVKLGAIAVPIGTRLSATEVAYQLADSAPRAAFIHPDTRATFVAAGNTPPVVIAAASAVGTELTLHALVAAHAPRRFDPPVEADDCMICYTSGTTGQPKGAILTQANYFIPNGYINAIEWGLTAADRQLITTPLTHRTAFGRVINTLCLGTTLVILPKFDPRETARLCAAERITVLGMVPTVGRMLLPAIEASPHSFASVRVMVATGEAFPRQVKERIVRALPQVGIYSYFAMTECGALTSLGPADQLSHPDSIGRLVPGVEVRFVDAAGRDAAPGEPGELWIRSGEPGRFLTLRGYWGKPAETAAALRDGWFATGDMGRMDADGFLYIVDRKKDMVLSGGYNIFSKEVELAILDHPSVQDVAVVGVPDAVYGEAVAAFVEVKPGAAALTEEQLILHCRDRIAGYKKPRHVRFVHELPRNSVGKILKYRLREEFAAALP